MIFDNTRFKLIVAPLSLALLALTGCGVQEQERPFEIAKNYVWGDALRGCEYQKMHIDDKSITYYNSKKLLSDRKDRNMNKLAIVSKQVEDLKFLEEKDDKFIFFWGKEGSKLEITIKNKHLIISGYMEKRTDVWDDIVDVKNDNGGIIPIKYKICSKK